VRSRDHLAARFEELASNYGDRLMGYMVRRVDADEAPDVAAETLLTAWRRVRVMPDDSEQAFWWLLAIARRTVSNYRRGMVRRTALANRLRAVTVAVSPVEQSDQVSQVREHLESLSADDQELIRLVYWDGLPINAAAAVLGIGEAAARKRMQRARSKLSQALQAPPVVTSLRS
jgi:RNA polymerase sigma-70 factor (ECF subfamily)